MNTPAIVAGISGLMRHHSSKNVETKVSRKYNLHFDDYEVPTCEGWSNHLRFAYNCQEHTIDDVFFLDRCEHINNDIIEYGNQCMLRIYNEGYTYASHQSPKDADIATVTRISESMLDKYFSEPYTGIIPFNEIFNIYGVQDFFRKKSIEAFMNGYMKGKSIFLFVRFTI